MSLEVAIRHRLGDFVLDAAFEAKGHVTALFGPSGSGKSSIVAAIAGLLRPRQGRIAAGGRLLVDAPKLFVPPERRRISVVFQDARLFPHFSVRDNLLFGWRRAPDRTDAAGVDRVIALLGLEALLDRFPRALSGGEKSRVALGRALLAAPAMLLLDEPLAALDISRRNEILPYLERLAREAELPMLYVSHQIEEVARLADEIVVLENGRVRAQGSACDLLTDIESVAGIEPLGAVFEAKVTAHLPDGLSVLAFDGGVLYVSRLSLAVGAGVRVRLRAEDIMLALSQPQDVSANNILQAHVQSVRIIDNHAVVRLLCGPTPLVARITASSRARLGLEPGTTVHAVVKSVTVGRGA
jgi:molybdate transport system ATP-binding protein